MRITNFCRVTNLSF